jgi:hypothetical protein
VGWMRGTVEAGDRVLSCNTSISSIVARRHP